MGKRSTFERLPRDLYRTIDLRAGKALIPHLPSGIRYAEPFAGAGDLVAQLAAHAECVLASDIEPLADGIGRADAFDVQVPSGAIVVTNPPWARSILHRAIVHFSNQCRTFLLFDANWAFTAQAVPYLDRCRKIVVIGRLRWIPGTTMQGKDDSAWFEFGQPIPGSRPVFYGRGVGPTDGHYGSIRRCYDCGQAIGSRAKWMLADRHGVVTTVHRFCTAPQLRHRNEPAIPAPLLDYIEKAAAPGFSAKSPGA